VTSAIPASSSELRTNSSPAVEPNPDQQP
jgi:hypothetical protein